MLDATKCPFSAVVLMTALMAFVSGNALSQQAKPSGGGTIVCWKDKSGKTVGCGDKVPPEYEDSATKELDRRGITRKTTETAEERAKREVLEKEQAVLKGEEKKRRAEQQRQDAALMNTFSDANEIDLKRDRDLQVVDTQLTQMRVAHKNAADREKELKTRLQTAEKAKGTPSDYNKDELARAQADMARTGKGITEKELEKEEIRTRYAGMKARYIQLKGGGTPAPKSTPVAKK